MSVSTCVIIVAGGTGSRMGQNKQLMPLLGKPVVAHTLEAFQRHPMISGIVLVRPQELAQEFRGIVNKFELSKVVQEADSGPTRQESVYNGLMKTPRCEIVLVHNGANPLVTEEEITGCINAARTYGAAAVAQPVKDTIKAVDKEEFVRNTLDRSMLRAMQTPQGLRYDLALNAYRHIISNNLSCTDDIQAAEMFDKDLRAKIVPASYQNIKLTTQTDVTFAESVLKLMKKGNVKEKDGNKR